MASVLHSKEASTHRAAAREFCALMEARRARPPLDWLGAVHALLPTVYASALALPEVEPETTGSAEHGISEEDWHALCLDVSVFLGRWNYYWSAYDPYTEVNEEPSSGSVADDLADIYRDLKDGLLLEESVGDERPIDVLWTWRFNFTSHWAAHATGVLRALQAAYFFHYLQALPETLGDWDSGTASPAA